MTLTTQTHDNQEPNPNELVIGRPGTGKSFRLDLTAGDEREREAK